MAQPTWIARINLVVHEAYVIGLAMFVLLLPMVPVHGHYTRNHNVSRVLSASRVEFQLSPDSRLVPGREVAVYRFNPGWRIPIGRATVERVQDGKAVARFDPNAFNWPMGLQGTVVQTRGRHARVDVGSEVGLKPKTVLNVYRRRQWVARLKVLRVQSRHADCLITETSKELLPDRRRIRGLTASPYVIPTQIAYLNAEWVRWVEYGLLVVFGLFVLGRFAQRELYARAAQAARGRLSRLGRRSVWMHALLGPPVVYVIISFTVLSLVRIARTLTGWLLPATASNVLSPAWSGLSDQRVHIALSVIAGVFYYVGLFGRRESPLWKLWRRLEYKPPEYRWFPWQLFGKRSWMEPRVLNWALQLVVAYAFAATLTTFLSNNLTAMIDYGWRDLGLNFRTTGAFFRSLGTLLTHRPDYRSPEAVYGILRLTLFSVTIVGCLVGYGHSCLSILWTKSIRNVDFTLLGWVTNGFCYGPLLGAVVWQMNFPGFGSDPGVSEGPLYHACHFADFFLNLLYTASIWNLGTMFGVMVDKGVRRSAFYNVVRHPNYTLEAAMFYVSFLLDMTRIEHAMSGLVYFITYWLRSEREDVFMSASNPAYVHYKEHVPWKFIPGIY